MPRLKHVIVILLVLFSYVGCDQATKAAARRYLPRNEILSFAGDILRLQYAENKGAFLSMGSALSEKGRGFLFKTGVGVDDFRRLLVPGKTFCLLGSSGVGKTTLINRLLGQDRFDTREVSGTGEGVHTTARRHLLVLDQGAMLIDTPGMRELGLLDVSEGIGESFAEIRNLARQCRFSDCTHTGEPGCSILMSLERGELSEERYRNYLKLRKESEHYDLSYCEKRKKDKAFGRFVKSAMKHIKE